MLLSSSFLCSSFAGGVDARDDAEDGPSDTPGVVALLVFTLLPLFVAMLLLRVVVVLTLGLRPGFGRGGSTQCFDVRITIPLELLFLRSFGTGFRFGAIVTLFEPDIPIGAKLGWIGKCFVGMATPDGKKLL